MKDGAGGATSTSEASSNASGVDASVTAASSSTGVVLGGRCDDPVPLISGPDNNVERCANGNYRLLRPGMCNVEPYGGVCGELKALSPDGRCEPSCGHDADCPNGTRCVCTGLVGVCMSALCGSDADCQAGEMCTTFDSCADNLVHLHFDCTTPDDECRVQFDCSQALPRPLGCYGSPRLCQDIGWCQAGRPFLVQQENRRAPATSRADWIDPLSAPRHEVGAALRATLASSWENVARMEHASIAAFARFLLQLLALGAPEALVSGARQALSDEITHTKMAFALASAYRGEPIGPGPLDVTGALDGAIDLRTVFSLLVREGCVGETVAALEAAELADACEDPSPQRVLARIAEDETRHGELAWRTVQWGLASFGDEVGRVLRDELVALEAELRDTRPEARSDEDARLARHGVATADYSAQLRREALARSVVPCLRALLDDATARAA